MKTSEIFGRNTYYSFILDPFILIGLAVLTVWLVTRKSFRLFGRSKAFTLWMLVILILSLTWLGAGALYFDLINMPFLGEWGQGNHFMWNSGIELFGIKSFVDTTVPTYTNFLSPLNLLALFTFAVLYPFFLYLGVKFGFKLFSKRH